MKRRGKFWRRYMTASPRASIRRLCAPQERFWTGNRRSPCSCPLPFPMTGMGLVSRVPPVHTALRNCTGDEGGPFGFGDQVVDPKPPRAAMVKSHGRERRGNAGTMIPAGKIERGERKRTASEASKAD